ncbi:MAG TPA: hypothetical protein DCX54_13070 [Flavobacteriales bacterium]|nr:hypothetical protein [Flavobacteriales bacterium]
MNKTFNRIILGAAAVLLIAGCNENSGDSTEQNSGEAVFDTMAHINAHRKTTENVMVHKVLVEEVIPTSNYVYLNVKEGEKNFWISSSNMEVKAGESYLYHEFMLQTNFKSKELDRIFDTLYLVSNMARVNSNGLSQTDAGSPSSANMGTGSSEGSITIADLVKNKQQYSGKTVQLSGTCVKINKAIMGRNWIHLKDGSMDSYDLVITSDENVPMGNFVTMKGVVALDKDFGASYQYELIVEDGRLVAQD